jgi:hypothetical protein
MLKLSFNYAECHQRSNGTAHFAHLKLDPIEGSSKKVNKTKNLEDKNEENSECFQL